MAKVNNSTLFTLNEYRDTLVGILKDNAPKGVSNALSESIIGTIEDDGISIDGNFYGNILNDGVPPGGFRRPPPIEALKEWASSKNINVYALQKSLFTNGIRQNNWIDRSITILDDLADEITYAIWNDFYDENKDKK